jgi:hypothetical protein
MHGTTPCTRLPRKTTCMILPGGLNSSLAINPGYNTPFSNNSLRKSFINRRLNVIRQGLRPTIAMNFSPPLLLFCILVSQGDEEQFYENPPHAPSPLIHLYQHAYWKAGGPRNRQQRTDTCNVGDIIPDYCHSTHGRPSYYPLPTENLPGNLL